MNNIPTIAPGPLNRLRQALAELDPTLAPRLAEPRREAVSLGLPALDAALGGGLGHGALHELAPEGPAHLGAATGFAAALAARAEESRGDTLWIATDFAAAEADSSHAPGLEAFGLATRRLLLLRLPRAADVLWAMEEALRCRALAAVVAELNGEGTAAGLNPTRRLVLAAREHAGFGLLLRHTPTVQRAPTKWVLIRS